MSVVPAPPVRPVADEPSFAEIVTAFPVATLIVDPENRIANTNVRAETLLNMARSAIIGSDIARTLRLADMEGRFDIWQTDKPLSAYDVHIHAGRNAELDADIMVAPIPEHDGWRIVSIHSKSQAQKIASSRNSTGARSAMGAAAILAHEIKNPLSGIRGAAQLLESNTDEGGTALTQLICNEVDRIAALIDRMQDFTTERTLECRPENIYPLIDRAAELASAGFAKTIKITKSYDPSLPFALINGDALVQVMINLLKNAAEALEHVEKPRIRIITAFRHGVSVTRVGGKGAAALPIEIQVLDNGPGVPDAIREHLFNPFVTGKRDGQGLGLALVDKIVRDMNGFVQYSREDDSGETIFRVLLPMGLG